jgi:hypothetical protein
MRPPQIAGFLNDYPNALARAKKFDDDLASAAFAATPQDSTYYSDILALSVRQMFANIELTAGWDGKNHLSTDIMAFLRGWYSVFVGPLVTD